MCLVKPQSTRSTQKINCIFSKVPFILGQKIKYLGINITQVHKSKKTDKWGDQPCSPIRLK